MFTVAAPSGSYAAKQEKADLFFGDRGNVRQTLITRIKLTRNQLERELHEELSRLKRDVPEKVLKLTLRDFLSLERLTISEETPLSTGKRIEAIDDAANNYALSSNYYETPVKRRMTRSMTAKQLAAPLTSRDDKRQTILSQTSEALMAATPKLHPGLPETPAAIRKRGRPRKSSQIITATPSQRPSAILRRSTRATIRASISVAGQTREEARNASRETNIMSVELQGGTLLDVDISRSPGQLVKELGTDAVREMKTKMQAYAAQLRSFFKRLKVHDN